MNRVRNETLFTQTVLKVFLLVFTSLKMHWNPKNDQVLGGKNKISS